jgi:putative aldouronate transport system permease protein
MKNQSIKKYLHEYWPFYVFAAPALLSVIIFSYVPMYGIQIAFKNYSPRLGIWGSEWVGLRHIIRFLTTPNALQLIRNTFLISFYSLIFGFPVPILLALMINEVNSSKYKRTVQMISYAPYFISTVAVIGIINLFFKRETGIVNLILIKLGQTGHNFIADPAWFRPLYIGSGIWQGAGWGTIIYLAILSQVDSEMVEAATIDGATRLQKIWHLFIPALLPIITIQLIMSAGGILSVGFEKAYLLQNSLNTDTSDVISTYVYRFGIMGGQFSFTTAIGFFNSMVNAVLLVIVNTIAKRLDATSLW